MTAFNMEALRVNAFLDNHVISSFRREKNADKCLMIQCSLILDNIFFLFRRRLSRYYFGKARLFAYTADVSGIEDLKSITMLRMKYSKLKIKEMQLYTPYLYRDGALCTALELHLHLALVWQYNQRYHLPSFF